ncbi:MAG: zinc-binding dehydrogenase [Propionibacteriaceae bacterium]|jgi:threonine dehydrogenase-like Zn-dependent dehydrogenase|nr:zinc-binding dehydrogenase [Propionibacteriaceae bacterium]
MKTTAVRMYGANDLRLETFDLPAIKDDEILVRVISDSICMSTYKLLQQGVKHKRCPADVAEHPIIVGHEFAGDIVQVGKAWSCDFAVGERFAQQPALNYKGSPASPGYSYRWCGGSATYAIMPHEVMELGCLLHYDGDSYFGASLGEPMSCIIGGYHANYHTNPENYDHAMGIKPGGNVLILGGAGPMGLGAVEYPLSMDQPPARIVVTDLSAERVERARAIITAESAAAKGVELHFVNVGDLEDQLTYLMNLTDGHGYDDVFIFAPVVPLAELGDKLLAHDGCMNFFAGPSDAGFTAGINLYNCHYNATHIMGTTGGNTDDLKEGLALSASGRIRPAVMITHIGGLNAVAETVAHLPQIPGGKKLMYTQVELPLTAIDDFEALGHREPLFAKLHELCAGHAGMWNADAEAALLDHFGVGPIV